MSHFGTVITNPILRGFNPEPSIVRVGDDYYLATSTLECYGRTLQPGNVGAGLRGMHNYLVSCQTIDSKWSDPVYSGVL
jgi:beta-xylosidase